MYGGSVFLFALSVTSFSVTGQENATKKHKTMFEELDDKLVQMLANPKPNECKHLLKLIQLYQTTMQRIRKGVEDNDTDMIQATQKVYDTGGPKFLQVRINEERFKRMGWSEEDLDQYYNLRLITDQAWYELRRILFGN